MISETLLTKDGHLKISKELDHMIKVERETIKKAIAEARALGDLRENAEYHSAKEKQSIIEGKIMELQGILAKARVVDVKNIKQDKVVFGATVTLKNVDGEQVTYQIVGERESDKQTGKISYLSPLGKSLIGKELGDTVVVKAPGGTIEYEIEGLDYI